MREKQKAYLRDWRARNKDRIKEYRTVYYHENRLACIAASRRWQTNHKDRVNQNARNWVKSNPEKVLECQRKQRIKHRERIKKSARNWYLKNKAKASAYWSNRRKTDLGFRIRETLRRRIRAALKSNAGIKAKKSSGLLGCPVTDFLIYLESRFEPGMTWDNYGFAWEIDHEIPCAVFDLTKPEHQKRCFHFSNQRPLWTYKNRQKRDRITTNQYGLL